VFWPLIGGFIAFLLIVIAIGWAVDPDRAGARSGNQDKHSH
jgi:hypothetical protein